MHSFRPYSLYFSILILSTIAAASGPTSIFIENASAYGQLSACAKSQFTTIVKNMSYDCGDGSQTTSYECFCFISSSQVSSRIVASVAQACTQETELAQNASAIDVFDQYCQIGTMTVSDSSSFIVAPTRTSSPSSHSSASATSAQSSASSASPAPRPVPTSTPTSTPSPSTAPEPKKKKSPVVAIAVSVSVPVAIIALGIVGFFLYRRRTPKTPRQQSDANELSAGGQIAQEPKPVEIGESVERTELASQVKQENRTLPGMHELYTEDLAKRQPVLHNVV
jgi:hypothetical protein